MKTNFKELRKEDFYNAVANLNADAFCVEDEATAELVYNAWKNSLMEEVDKDSEDFEIAMESLDMIKENNPRHIYESVNLTICFEEDFDLA